MQDSMIGVGSALRKARERRGITLDAASRDTKLHIDQLRALEAEDFEALMGDVYVRGSLRTYSQYLGLSPDKVIGAYDRHAETPPPPAPPARLGRIERAMAASRIRDNQLLMILLAGTVLVVAVVFGLLSRGHSAPVPGDAPHGRGRAGSARPADRRGGRGGRRRRRDRHGRRRGVDVRDGGRRDADVHGADRPRSSRSTDGGAIRLTVNGVDYGIPGHPGPAVESIRSASTRTKERRRRRERASRDRRGRDRAAARSDRQHQRAVDLRTARHGGGRRAAPPGGRRQHPADRRGAAGGARPGRRRARDRRARADRGRPHARRHRGAPGRADGAASRDRGPAAREVRRLRPRRHAAQQPPAGRRARRRADDHTGPRHRAGARGRPPRGQADLRGAGRARSRWRR